MPRLTIACDASIVVLKGHEGTGEEQTPRAGPLRIHIIIVCVDLQQQHEQNEEQKRK